jgi:hypothetical protein
VLEGFNDLSTTAPLVAAEWHPTLNMASQPTEFVQTSEHKAWWLCAKKHEWRAQIYSRTAMNTGCPFCAGKKAWPGFNDIETLFPEIASQWDQDLNDPVRPSNVTAGSNKSFWWRCELSHTWKTTPYQRIGRGAGCHYCAGQKVLSGQNDLATVSPLLALEFCRDKNPGITPSEIFAHTSHKYWWCCEQGHQWLAAVSARSSGTGCPTCSSSGGYQSTRAGTLYFISHPNLRSRKIGITNPEAKEDRLARFDKHGWQLVQKWSDPDGALIADVETALLRWLRIDLGLHPYLTSVEVGSIGGHSETFSADGPTDDEIIQQIDVTIRRMQSIRFST